MTVTKSLPRLVLTAEGPDFNPTTLSNWKDEGYQVTYLPLLNNKKDFINKLNRLADPLESGETYAIVGLLSRSYYWIHSTFVGLSANQCIDSIWRSRSDSPRTLFRTFAKIEDTGSILSHRVSICCCGLSPELKCSTASSWLTAKGT